MNISKQLWENPPTHATHGRPQRTPPSLSRENHIFLTTLMTLTFLKGAEVERGHILYSIFHSLKRGWTRVALAITLNLLKVKFRGDDHYPQVWSVRLNVYTCRYLQVRDAPTGLVSLRFTSKCFLFIPQVAIQDKSFHKDKHVVKSEIRISPRRKRGVMQMLMVLKTHYDKVLTVRGTYGLKEDFKATMCSIQCVST